MVRINGENIEADGKTILEYLNSAGYDLMRVAVELNDNIVPKVQYTDTILKNGDRVYVVCFVGGG